MHKLSMHARQIRANVKQCETLAKRHMHAHCGNYVGADPIGSYVHVNVALLQEFFSTAGEKGL